MKKILKGGSLANTEEKPYNYVYKQTRDNGEYYIGIHSTDKAVDYYNGSGTLFTIKYKADPDSFTMEILYEFDTRLEASDMEGVLVTEETIKEPLCLNLMPGGDNGYTFSKEHKGKISASMSGKKHPRYDPTIRTIVKFESNLLTKVLYKTQQEILAEFPEMDSSALTKMLSRKKKTCQGWMLPETAKNPPPKVIIHTIENPIHGVDSGTVRQLLAKYPEMNNGGLSLMLSGKQQTHHGWSLKKK
jgi:hypothetical protein